MGAVSILAGMLIVIFFTGSFLMLGSMWHWRDQIKTQLALDLCVSKAAKKVKSTLNEIETLNLEIEVVRQSIRALRAAPVVNVASETSLKTLLIILSGLQDTKRYSYEFFRTSWMGGLFCREELGFPNIGFFRDPGRIPWQVQPPDDVGPNTLTWEGNREARMEFIAKKQVRFSIFPKSNRLNLKPTTREGKAEINGDNYGYKRNWKSMWSKGSSLP